MSKKRRTFGRVRQLPSKMYQASYLGPDLIRYNAPYTFRSDLDADRWLVNRYDEIANGTWTPPDPKPKESPLTFGEYAQRWLPRRTLARSTRSKHEGQLKNHLLPTFGDRPLHQITRADVREWFWQMNPEHPAARKNAYVLLHSIMEHAAEEDELIDVNPVKVKGGATYLVDHDVDPATLDELAVIVEHLPEDRRLMVLLSTWCALRFGEVTELRRSDIDLRQGIVKVKRGVVHVDGEVHVGDLKTKASKRDVAIPPHLHDAVRDHLNTFMTGRDGLLFTSRNGKHLSEPAFYGTTPTKTRKGSGYAAARAAAGRPDLHFHDLRHTGATMAGQDGATLSELMHRLGHTSPKIAMRYQWADAERDRALAARMSKRVTGTEA